MIPIGLTFAMVGAYLCGWVGGVHYGRIAVLCINRHYGTCCRRAPARINRHPAPAPLWICGMLAGIMPI
jgi:hypothetical protein